MPVNELNQNLRFASLSTQEQTSFKGAAVLVRLALGEELYKWTQYGLINPSGGVSSFWCPRKTLHAGGMTAPGFAELSARSANTGDGTSHPQDYARARNAVRLDWNEMTSMLKARLLTPVWGFLGVCRHQPLQTKDPPEGEAKVFLIGGDYQLCIPNMTAKNIVKL